MNTPFTTDINKFKALFLENFESICIFAERYLDDMEQARDVVHDVFLKLWDKPDEIVKATHTKTYLYAIVRNRCIDLLRRRNLHKQFMDLSLTEYRGSDMFFETEMIREDVYVMLDKAVQNLPERSREIILMKLEGYKNREIAEKLNISVNTVNTLKTNAYNTLRYLLDGNPLLLALLFVINQTN